jgi:hypothetical protein
MNTSADTSADQKISDNFKAILTRAGICRSLVFSGSLVFFFCCGGCTTYEITQPPRATTEQLLLSTAADRALHSVNLGIFAGQRVFLDTTYFDSYDNKYVIGTIRDALSRAGAFLVTNANASDVIIEARSGGLSTDGSTSFVGIPSFGLPIPLAGTLATPELAFYKSQKQHSTAKIALLAITTQSREHVYSSGPLVGKSYNNYHDLFGFSGDATDVPEKHKKPETVAQYESWQPYYTPPHYELTNPPPAVRPPTNILSTNTPPASAPKTNNLPAQPIVSN